MDSKLKKNDWILILGIVCIAALTLFVHEWKGENGVGVVTIKVNGKITGRYSLEENQEIEINDGSNLLKIKDGEADMISADCPDKLCVHQKAISKDGESIICLPNQVVVEIESSESSEYDAVTN
ncbi:MAG: NusG domain II-containing protein [Dorea sp.]|nr:NusG domain II-containing protein [Dorea sp.]MDY2813706.1 NusG domain II-containing protein [Dorea sp.]